MSLSTENPTSIPPAFHQLFHTYSPDEIIGMVHSVARVNGQSATTEIKATKRAVIAHPKKKMVAVAAPSKATRPLNSWIAFRSYYSTMFTSLQQKEISGFLTYLWQTDPFKAKWSILAKAYSLIRDSIGKEKAPLDSYLAIIGPFIGIVPPEQYLEILGWEIVAGGDGGKLLRRDFDVDFDSLDQDLFTSNVSVNDIIEYSYASGYVAADEGNLIVPDNEPAMTMATSVQHNLPMKSANFAPVHKTTSDASGPTTAVTMVVANDASKQTVSETAAPLPDREATGDASSSTDVGTDTVASMDSSNVVLTETGLNGSEVTANTQTVLAPQVSLPNSQVPGTVEQAAVLGNPLLGPDITELAQLAAPVVLPAPKPVNHLKNNPSMFFGKNDCYPYNNHFVPGEEVYEFDPYMGDEFNAFDLEDFRKFISYPGM